MGIRSIEIAKKLRNDGKRLGRVGLAARVCVLIDEFNKNRSFKNAIVLAGKLKAISQACKFDGYWDEKCSMGFEFEQRNLEYVSVNGELPENKESWWIK